MTEQRLSGNMRSKMQISVDHNMQKASTPSTPTTHIVRINVLGFEGIHVDAKHEKLRRQSSLSANKYKAVIAVAKGQKIKATTSLSQTLTKTEKTLSTDSTRYWASWDSKRNIGQGYPLEFETTFEQTTATLGKTGVYAPKIFTIIAALTADTEHSRKVALPIGIANVPISVNKNEKKFALDLPLLGLKQAHPSAEDKNGLFGFQMMSIQDSCSSSDSKKKRTRKSIFKRKQEEGNCQKIPSVAERRNFSSTFWADANRNSTLRVELEIIEKASPLTVESNLHTQIESSSKPLKSSLRRETTSPPILVKKLNIPIEEQTVSTGTKSTSVGSMNTEEIRSNHSSEKGSLESLVKDPSIISELRNVTKIDPPGGDLGQDLGLDNVATETEPPTTFSNHRKIRGSTGSRKMLLENLRLSSCAAAPISLRHSFVSTRDNGGPSDELRPSEIPSGGFSRTVREILTCGIQHPLDLHNHVGNALKRAERVLGKCDGADQVADHATASTENLHLEQHYGPTQLNRNELPKVHEKPSRLANTLIDIIPCGKSRDGRKGSDLENKMNFLRAKNFNIPQEIIPKRTNSDEMTAITIHEDIQAPELEMRRNNPFSPSGNRGSRFPFPAAFGGPGMCTGLDFVDDGDTMGAVVTNKLRLNFLSGGTAQKSSGENYFQEYDHCSIDRPRSRKRETELY